MENSADWIRPGLSSQPTIASSLPVWDSLRTCPQRQPELCIASSPRGTRQSPERPLFEVSLESTCNLSPSACERLERWARALIRSWGIQRLCTQGSLLPAPCSWRKPFSRSPVLFAWFCPGHDLHSLDGLSGSGVSSSGQSRVAAQEAQEESRVLIPAFAQLLEGLPPWNPSAVRLDQHDRRLGSRDHAFTALSLPASALRGPQPPGTASGTRPC